MASRHGSLWTRDEHILAFNLYCQIPFGAIHMGNPRIVELGALLGRSVGSVSYKLSNFARLDPALRARGIRGNEHGAKGEEAVWQEFAADPESLVFESETLLADRLGKTIEDVAQIGFDELPRAGIEREAIVRIRVNQNFFRRRIVSAYEYECCVTGLAVPELLVASHISPWASDAANRLNPINGLCLNAIHDRAFDRGLMWIDDKFEIHFAERLHANSNLDAALSWLIGFEGQRLRLPREFAPSLDFLRAHATRHGY